MDKNSQFKVRFLTQSQEVTFSNVVFVCSIASVHTSYWPGQSNTALTAL